MIPQAAKDRRIYEGEIATYWMEEGILVARSKRVRRTVENIAGNGELIRSMTGNAPLPLLIYLVNSPVPDKATRKFAAKQLPNIYSAMAMVSEPGLAKFIMNLLFTFKPPPLPMKSFTNDAEAKQWLKQFIR